EGGVGGGGGGEVVGGEGTRDDVVKEAGEPGVRVVALERRAPAPVVVPDGRGTEAGRSAAEGPPRAPVGVRRDGDAARQRASQGRGQEDQPQGDRGTDEGRRDGKGKAEDADGGGPFDVGSRPRVELLQTKIPRPGPHAT